MENKNLKIGDVVQISPDLKDSFFSGCFMTVAEVKDWGAQGFICMPGKRGDPPGHAYFRAKWEDMEYVGPATWVLGPPKETPQESLNE